jgi:ribosomal protein L29
VKENISSNQLKNMGPEYLKNSYKSIGRVKTIQEEKKGVNRM